MHNSRLVHIAMPMESNHTAQQSIADIGAEFLASCQPQYTGALAEAQQALFK